MVVEIYILHPYDIQKTLIIGGWGLLHAGTECDVIYRLCCIHAECRICDPWLGTVIG